jgi:hypothetical protein
MRTAVLFILLMACAPVHAADSADAAAHRYYTYLMQRGHGSTPFPAGSLDAMRRLLSPQLADLLARASAAQAQCVATTPDGVKPLLLEGPVFFGSDGAGATSYRFRAWRRNGGSASVEVDLTLDFKYPGGGGMFDRWRDRLLLERSGTHWQVSEVVLDTAHPLSVRLRDFIRAAADCSAQKAL